MYWVNCCVWPQLLWCKNGSLIVWKDVTLWMNAWLLIVIGLQVWHCFNWRMNSGPMQYCLADVDRSTVISGKCKRSCHIVIVHWRKFFSNHARIIRNIDLSLLCQKQCCSKSDTSALLSAYSTVPLSFSSQNMKTSTVKFWYRNVSHYCLISLVLYCNTPGNFAGKEDTLSQFVARGRNPAAQSYWLFALLIQVQTVSSKCKLVIKPLQYISCLLVCPISHPISGDTMEHYIKHQHITQIWWIQSIIWKTNAWQQM